MKSTTAIIAFDQHAATTVAAVLLPGHRTPALHTLASDSPTILRFVDRLRRQRAVTCCYEAGPCGFELRRALQAREDPVRRDRPRADPAPAGRSHQNGSTGCRTPRRAVSSRRAHGDPHSHRAGRGGARSVALSRRHPGGPAPRPTPALQVSAAPWPSLHRDEEGLVQAPRRLASSPDLAAARP